MVVLLNHEGVQLKTGKSCDDVGVQMTGNNTRRASTSNNRIQEKGAARSKRTRDLVKINPVAIKLAMPGTNAVQIYGHQAQGASALQMDLMNRNLKNTTQFAKTRACVATVLAWHFGPSADARVGRPLEQIDAWLHLWTSTLSTHRHDTRFTW